MTQHVAHRSSDEIANLRAEVERLEYAKSEARYRAEVAERKLDMVTDALSEAKEWIDADEGFLTDFPEEWERLTGIINAALARARSKGGE